MAEPNFQQEEQQGVAQSATPTAPMPAGTDEAAGIIGRLLSRKEDLQHRLAEAQSQIDAIDVVVGKMRADDSARHSADLILVAVNLL